MNPDLLLTEANACFDELKFEEAAKLYQEVLRQDPGNVEAAFNLGCVHLELGELDEAIARLTTILGKPRGGFEAHLNLAKAYLLKMNFDLSEHHAKIVLNIDRYNLIALYVAALSCFNLGKVPAAVTFAERLVALDGANPVYHLVLAEICESSGDRGRMMEHLSRAVELDDNLDAVHEKIAGFHLEQGEVSQAILTYEKLLKHSPSPPIFLTLYLCYLLDSKYDEAANLLEKLFSNDDTRHRYLSAVALCLQGDKGGVVSLLKNFSPSDQPALDQYYARHTVANQQIIKSAIEKLRLIVDPPNYIFLSGKYQTTKLTRSAGNVDLERPLLVWGLSAATRSLISLSRVAGFRPVGVVVENSDVSEYEHLPVYLIQDVARHDQLSEIPIVVSGDGNTSGPASFKEILKALKQEHRVANRVLHSSFLIDFLKFPPTTHFVLNGYMGSGNFIHYNLLNQILSEHTKVPDDPGLQLCTSLAYDYYLSVMDFFNGLFKPFGLESLESAVIFRNAFYGGWGDPKVEKRDSLLVRIYGLPSRFYAMSRLHVTHEPLEPDTLDFFCVRGLNTLVFVRHPLDTIVSCSAKLHRQNPEIVLNNPAWFSSMIEVLEKYFSNYVKLLDRITVFRYEDLLAEPRENVIRLGESVGCHLTGAQADSLWSKFGFKSLDPRDPNHLWRPGANKWKKYMSSWHLELVKASNLMNLAMNLGYDSNLEIDEIKPGLKSDKIPYQYPFGDFTFYGGTGKRLVQPPPDNLFWMDERGRAMVMSNEEELLSKARSILESSVFDDLRAACFWEEEPRTLLNKD